MSGAGELRPLRPSNEDSPSSDLFEDENGRRRNVRTACTECKRRKLKCSGTAPCDKCLKSGTRCHIDEKGDQRRKQVLKRKIETVEDHGDLLDRLVSTLRDADRSSAMHLVNMIRSQAKPEALRDFIDDLRERPRLEKTPELIDAISGVREWHLKHRKDEASSSNDKKSPATRPLFNVPAWPWTTLTDDDEFVSNLISLWFTWIHPFLNWLDRDLFIRDMQSGDLKSEFCSPFLVNIMLAEAAVRPPRQVRDMDIDWKKYQVYSDDPRAFTVAAQEWSRGLQFYKEAKLLLDTEQLNITIPYVQGLASMYVCSCMIGNDRVGWLYISQLAYAARELSQKHRTPPKDADKNILRKARAIEHTLWGVFNLTAMTSLSYQKGCMMKAPRTTYLTKADNGKAKVVADDWTDFPIRSNTVQSQTQDLFDMFCQVSRITHDLSWSLFEKGDKKQVLDPEFVRIVDDAYDRLETWYRGFPASLKIDHAPPHVLSFHMKYHTIIQTMYGVLKDVPNSEDMKIDPEWEQRTRDRAKRLCVNSACEIARLISVHRDLWTLSRMAGVNIHWVTVSMFTLLPCLDAPANRVAIGDLAHAARSFAHRWSLGKGMLRIFQVTARQKKISLPAKARSNLVKFEANNWSLDDGKMFRSQYPNFANSMKRGEVDEVELDKFLAKFDAMYFTDYGDDVIESSGKEEIVDEHGTPPSESELEAMLEEYGKDDFEDSDDSDDLSAGYEDFEDDSGDEGDESDEGVSSDEDDGSDEEDDSDSDSDDEMERNLSVETKEQVPGTGPSPTS